MEAGCDANGPVFPWGPFCGRIHHEFLHLGQAEQRCGSLFDHGCPPLHVARHFLALNFPWILFWISQTGNLPTGSLFWHSYSTSLLISLFSAHAKMPIFSLPSHYFTQAILQFSISPILFSLTLLSFPQGNFKSLLFLQQFQLSNTVWKGWDEVFFLAAKSLFSLFRMSWKRPKIVQISVFKFPKWSLKMVCFHLNNDPSRLSIFLVLKLIWSPSVNSDLFSALRTSSANQPDSPASSRTALVSEFSALHIVGGHSTVRRDVHRVVFYILGEIFPIHIIPSSRVFFFQAIWEEKYYYLFGFLFLVFIILVISCAQIAIVVTYFQLCAEVIQAQAHHHPIFCPFFIPNSFTQ